MNEKENEIKLLEKSKLIILTIALNTKKIKECCFEIEEIVEEKNIQINDIYSYVSQLLKKVNILEEKNKFLEQKIKILEENNIKLERKIEEIYFYFPISERKKEKEKEIELERIKNWIAPGKKVQLNLIFKKSRDGDTSEDFHKYCDNIKKTLILIETKEGRKFGGFTYNYWNNSSSQVWNGNKEDFVFSLDLNKKYNNMHINGCSTLGYKDNGPIFGYCLGTNEVDICIGKSLNYGISKNSPCFKTNLELMKILKLKN